MIHFNLNKLVLLEEAGAQIFLVFRVRGQFCSQAHFPASTYDESKDSWGRSVSLARLIKTCPLD